MADFYQILGVSRDADANTLKSAYRKLARQYHPDVNKDPGAEDKFKEIGKAYEALADPETRARYDQFGEAGIGGAAGMPDMGDMGGFGDLFETFFNGFGGQSSQGGRSQRRGPQQGDDLRYDLNIDFKDAIFGQQREINIPHLETCEVCRGTGAKKGTGPTTCTTCGGSGQVRRATRTPFGNFTQVAECPTCNGVGQIISDPCTSCGGNGVKQVRKKLRINIPAGVDSGTKLRVSGEGNVGLKGGPPGDLYVFIKVKNDSNLKREGINIYSEISVSYLQAILGDTVDIITVDGKVNLKIPSGTQPNSTLSLENKGVPRLGNPVARGNHQVLVKVKLPTRITEDERNLLEDLASKYTEQNSSSNSGLFSRLFGKDS
ncbi:DnaJ protein [Prochlorococcus marinus subsp. pastoris str. CCMP1986]|uniref:Chaperone protein DnaJ n=1 Tax=Prochlorococcus marinus subsp. pastoris (strain CCMP1986 / NIES-2087 / MED4) TaxID=59919 RepID=DNAJ_PROMP|nr:molecular chaperone DnaJ [Prochlorococcus marinus]Q7V3Q3.1 RecName: Full=Chaperone protein DnaJ [Prochlorococcus marinus subsp. pastoris str. CCMP1986]KGF88236.1 Chaperone protein DnaJ [Prochlorococcus marinus str. EQPAC1]CAE18476.1 DnaJ protein [Prochlorococcus marinus subsp. pastoris str. CCMP1986]